MGEMSTRAKPVAGEFALSAAERSAIAKHLQSSVRSEPRPAAPTTARVVPPPRPWPSVKPRKCTANELPAYRHREELLATVRAARVTLVRGATGCGKSTQLPRLMLLEAAAAGTPCAIVVAQPRRLAAMALAERVASELGEGVGGVCGYRVRGDARASAETALTYVTTGVLLRLLEEDAALQGFSHVVVDEVRPSHGHCECGRRRASLPRLHSLSPPPGVRAEGS